MALKGPGERLQKYSDKLIPSRVTSLLVTKKSGMVSKMEGVVNRQIEVEARVRGIYATKTGTTVADAAFYQGFAKRADRIAAAFAGGEVLDCEYAALVDQFKVYGIVEATMLQILNEVFAWTPPAP